MSKASDEWPVERHSKGRKRWGQTSSFVTCCKIACMKSWAKGTIRFSWAFTNNMLPERWSQFDCLLFVKPVHISRPEWRKPWVTGGDRVQALLTSVDDTPFDIHKLVNSLKLRDLWTWWYSKGMPHASSKRISGTSEIFMSCCLRLSHFSKILEGSKNDEVTKTL
jgi:hypothetical protein